MLVDSATLVRSRAIALLALALIAGCREWQGDRYLRHYAPRDRAREEASYRFGLPGDGWRPVRKLPEVQVAWVHDDLAAVIQVHAQCDEQGDSSLDQFLDHLRIDFTDWKVLQEKEFQLVGRGALRATVDAELDGVLRRNEFVVVKKNGCLFDLQYSAPPEHFTAGQPDFEAVVQGFRFPLEDA